MIFILGIITGPVATQTMILLPKSNQTATETWKCSFKYLKIIHSPASFMQHDCKNKLRPSLSSCKLDPEGTIWKNLHHWDQNQNQNQNRFYCQVSSYIRGICSNVYMSLWTKTSAKCPKCKYKNYKKKTNTENYININRVWLILKLSRFFVQECNNLDLDCAAATDYVMCKNKSLSDGWQ